MAGRPGRPGVRQHVWIGAFSGLLTFLILVFSEIIPKTLGAYYWKRFAGFSQDAFWPP